MQATFENQRRYQPHEIERLRSLQGLTLASFGARATAFAIDFLLAVLLFVPFALLVGKLLERVLKHDIHIELDLFHNWYSLIYLVLFFGLSLYWGNGRTLGKRLMGIRVVSLVHESIGLWHGCERALGYGASTLERGFGFVQYFIHPNRQTVHDRIAETIVISERA